MVEVWGMRFRVRGMKIFKCWLKLTPEAAINDNLMYNC